MTKRGRLEVQSTTPAKKPEERRSEFARTLRALNGQFYRWICEQQQASPAELWSEGVEDYIAHAQDITSEFADILEDKLSDDDEVTAQPAPASKGTPSLCNMWGNANKPNAAGGQSTAGFDTNAAWTQQGSKSTKFGDEPASSGTGAAGSVFGRLSQPSPSQPHDSELTERDSGRFDKKTNAQSDDSTTFGQQQHLANGAGTSNLFGLPAATSKMAPIGSNPFGSSSSPPLGSSSNPFGASTPPAATHGDDVALWKNADNSKGSTSFAGAESHKQPAALPGTVSSQGLAAGGFYTSSKPLPNFNAAFSLAGRPAESNTVLGGAGAKVGGFFGGATEATGSMFGGSSGGANGLQASAPMFSFDSAATTDQQTTESGNDKADENPEDKVAVVMDDTSTEVLIRENARLNIQEVGSEGKWVSKGSGVLTIRRERAAAEETESAPSPPYLVFTMGSGRVLMSANLTAGMNAQLAAKRPMVMVALHVAWADKDPKEEPKYVLNNFRFDEQAKAVKFLEVLEKFAPQKPS